MTRGYISSFPTEFIYKWGCNLYFYHLVDQLNALGHAWLFFFFCPFLYFLLVPLARRLNVEFDWKRCYLSVVQTLSLVSQSTFQISFYIAQTYVLGMIARQWFVIHMPLRGLIREGMFWLDDAARVLNFYALCYKSENLFGHTCCMHLENSRFPCWRRLNGEMIKA